MSAPPSPSVVAGDQSGPPAPPTRPARLGAAAAWFIWLAAVASAAIGLVYGLASQSGPLPTPPQSLVSFIAATSVAVTYATVGLLLRLRRPGIVIGWLFLGIGFVSGLGDILWNYVWYSESIGSAVGPISPINAATLNTLIVVPGWTVLLFVLIMLFPDGHLVDRSWRPALALAVAISGVFAVALALDPGPLLFFPTFPNPYAPAGFGGQVVGVVAGLTTVAIAILGFAAVWSMVVRYRRSDEIGRHQLKWLAWGSSLSVFGGVILLFVAIRTPDPRTNVADISWLVFAAGSMALPVAALIAILREGLYDIDQLIGRTFVYGVLTAILAGVYAASVRLFNALFTGLTGESSELALVLTTLILATTFTPIKQGLERIVARRFAAAVAAGSGGVGAETAGVVEVASAGVPEPDLDRRIEAIARRVAEEVLAGQRAATPGSLTRPGPGQDVIDEG